MSLIQGRKMSDYDRGNWLFRMYAGNAASIEVAELYALPANAPRAMIDGWNKARKNALQFSTSMNARMMEKHIAGKVSMLSSRAMTHPKASYPKDSIPKSERDDIAAAKFQATLDTMESVDKLWNTEHAAPSTRMQQMQRSYESHKRDMAARRGRQASTV